MLDARDPLLQAPFGWSVTHRHGARPSGFSDELSSLQLVCRKIAESFPAARGYRVVMEEDSRHLRATVSRRQFRARLTLAMVEEDGRTTVRLHGLADDRRVDRIRRRADGLIRRNRTLALVGAMTLFAGICWLCIGVYNPVFFLGGMFMAVVLLALLLGASGAGLYLAERAAERWMVQLRQCAARDQAFQTDLQRWRALGRELARFRPALAGRRRLGPFRGQPTATVGSALSAFSFSS